jgi:hypothetical protein
VYTFVRTLIDDVLMGPQLAPFTTFALVIGIAFSALNVISRGSDETTEQEPD